MFTINFRSHEYRADRVLLLCRKYKIIDAMSYLLEKNGEFTEAYALIFQVWNDVP